MKKSLLLTGIVAMGLALSSCGDKAASGETSTETTAAAAGISGKFNVDAAKTVVGWTGSKVAYSHVGTVKVQSGAVQMENGNISGGEFVIDMNTIMENGTGPFNDAQKVTDLVGHLKAPDFFDVAKWPTAKLAITGSTAGGADGATHTLNGNLTIKDITKPISFPATVTATETGLTATAKFKVNRTDYDIRYGSGKFFENLGDKLINDDMDFDVTLVATK